MNFLASTPAGSRDVTHPGLKRVVGLLVAYAILVCTNEDCLSIPSQDSDTLEVAQNGIGPIQDEFRRPEEKVRTLQDHNPLAM